MPAEGVHVMPVALWTHHLGKNELSMSGTGDHVLPFPSTVLLRAWVSCFVLAILNSLSMQLREEREESTESRSDYSRYTARDNFSVDHGGDTGLMRRGAGSLEALPMILYSPWSKRPCGNWQTHVDDVKGVLVGLGVRLCLDGYSTEYGGEVHIDRGRRGKVKVKRIDNEI